MITRDEIEAKGLEFGIHVADVQRDYVFGWFLLGVYTVTPLKDALILKGGNCFRKAYFPNTRFSNDLDFSVGAAIDQRYLADALNNICDFVHESSGVVFHKDRNRVEEKATSDGDRKIYE